jgi:penicillin-binding protein 1A
MTAPPPLRRFLRPATAQPTRPPRAPVGVVAVVLTAALGWSSPTPAQPAPLPAPPSAFSLPSLDPIVNYQPRLPLRVLTADGVEIGQFGEQRRQFVPLAQIPRVLQEAVLAVEDTRFYDHGGIDPRGLARAMVSTLTGGMRQGGSTITQQLVRTMLLTHRFSAERKLKEMWLAVQLEQQVPKARILEIYLNEVYLGQRSYGVAAAARTYFGKALAELTLAEAALIAGLPQNPGFANPVADLDRALVRQRVVLARMRAVGFITPREEAAARAERLSVRPPGSVPLRAGHVAEMARRAVVERFGETAYARGLVVTTSITAVEQAAAVDALRRTLLAHDRRGTWRGPEAVETLPAATGENVRRVATEALRDHRDDELLRVAVVISSSASRWDLVTATGETITLAGDALRWAGRVPPRGAVVRVMRTGAAPNAPWTLVQWPEAEGAVVALEPVSGRVRALVGSFDYTRVPFNHATQAWRQPGSALKPLLVSAALEAGVQPATVVDDQPYVAANGWSPDNADRRFDGPLTVRQAVARSRNLPAVRLVQAVGVEPARQWLGRFGLDPARHPADLTLALGTGSVTPMQMAAAYAVVANGGFRVDPVLIERIADRDGRTLFQAQPAQPLADARRVLPARNAFVTQQLLAEVLRSGTAVSAHARLGRDDLAGKTGTTDDAVDAWFAGFHPSLAAAVWLGYREPRSLGPRESGGALALPVWTDLMATALRAVPAALPSAPAGVAWVQDDWRYEEWAADGWIARIEADGPFASRMVPAAPAAAASAPPLQASAPAPAPALPLN